jgi:hypothetical protein
VKKALTFIILATLLSSCSQRRSTAEIAGAMTDEIDQLPLVLRVIENEESASVAVESIQKMRDSVVALTQEVEKGELLTREERLVVERKLRRVQDESAFILQSLSAKPAVLIQLSGPLSELGDALEFASRVMKGKP